MKRLKRCKIILARLADPTHPLEPVYYNVILITNNQDHLANALKINYNATNIFQPANLSTVVTADIPIDQMVSLSMHENVIKMGDGELTLHSTFDNYDSSNLTHSSLAEAKLLHSLHSKITSSGMDVRIGLIDQNRLLPHGDLPSIQVAFCTSALDDPQIPVTCTPGDRTGYNDPHANQAISIMVGTGRSNSEMKGVAPDSDIYYTSATSAGGRIAALSHLVGVNADLVLMISGIESSCTIPSNINNSYQGYPAIAFVVDEVVDRGIPVVTAAGNQGDGNVSYDALLDVACAYNSIAVGNIDKDKNIWETSSRGGSSASNAVHYPMKPDISALGVAIAGASSGTSYIADTGTSFSSPLVAGTVALLLDAGSNLTPQEIKVALMVGAEAREFSTGTANDYEARASPVYNAINQYGLGILNVQESLDTVNSDNDRLVSGQFGTTGPNEYHYRIYAGQTDLVKLFLNYPYKPVVDSNNDLTTARPLFTAHHPSLQIANFNINVTSPNGNTMQSNSMGQTTEFVIFEADTTGYYDIAIYTTNTFIVYNDTHNFIPYSLGSSHRIETSPFPDTTNHPPTVIVTASPSNPSSGDTVTLTAVVSDYNSDTVTVEWSVVRNDIPISLNVFSNGRSAEFIVPHHEDKSSATFTVKATATDQHNTSSNPSTVHVAAMVTDNTDTTRPTITAPSRQDLRGQGSANPAYGSADWNP